MEQTCTHLQSIRPVEPSSQGCVDCLASGRRDWVHLRLCVGCCDNSSGRHATKHFSPSANPIIQSFQPGENWLWCHVNEIFVVP
jgi:hypothetical protein